MRKTYFVKVSELMSWNTLKEKINFQKINKSKPLPFKVVAKVNVSSKDFDKLSFSIGKTNALYAPYTALSVASFNGIWNCIFIKCSNDYRNILIYTAGNMFPLYASIIE